MAKDRVPAESNPIHLNFIRIKESDITASKNTMANRRANDVAAQLKMLGPGEALKIDAAGAKPHFKFTLQRKLQKMGHKVVVIRQADGSLAVKRVS
jgi:hypothetical protein